MSLYVDDEIPRYKDEDDTLTVLEKSARDRAVAEIIRLNPSANAKLAELAWNYIHREGVDNIREKINTGFYNKPSRHAKPPGGTIVAGFVYNPDGSLYDPEVDDHKDQFIRGENISC